MGPREVDLITHRELFILLRSATEAVYDEYEHLAFGALMNRQAYHAKKLKFSDLFTRPLDVVEAKNRQKELINQQEQAELFLSRYKLGDD